MAWHKESKRHSLASKGIKTAQKINFIPSMKLAEQQREKELAKKIKIMSSSDTLPFSETTLKSFHLPIETAVYVPSTTRHQQDISDSQFQERIELAEKQLATMFGGFTTAEVKGGFTLANGKIKKERVAKVVVFTDGDSLIKKKAQLKEWLLKKGKDWHQESMGFEVEGDLYYLSKK